MVRTIRRQSPRDYLERTISLIQRRALHSVEVDWAQVRHESLKMAHGAETTFDTYAAIKYVLKELKDGHSFLVPARGTQAKIGNPELSGVQRGKRGKIRKPALLGKIGYIPLKSVSAARGKAALRRYAEEIRQRIEAFAVAGSDSWIFDLRANGGGTMWPMLAGVGPILGTGIVGYFESPRLSVPWYYESGVAGIETARGRRKLCEVKDTIPDFGAEQTVAILIDNTTASSAEAIAIAFKGRGNTAYFGQSTAGLSTCNDEVRLPDGAKIYLTVAIDADRNGNLYNAGLEPDFRTAPIDSANELEPAIAWLHRCNIR
jgi:carboxyl-terminal processing protease